MRHVSEDQKPKPAAADSRGELMDQIRLGVTLKKVDPELLSRDDDVTSSSSSGIAGMLQKALRKDNPVVIFLRTWTSSRYFVLD